MFKKSWVSKTTKDTPPKKERQSFKTYELGFIHLDIASLHTDEGKAYLFVAVERKTRLVYAELYTKKVPNMLKCL